MDRSNRLQREAEDKRKSLLDKNGGHASLEKPCYPDGLNKRYGNEDIIGRRREDYKRGFEAGKKYEEAMKGVRGHAGWYQKAFRDEKDFRDDKKSSEDDLKGLGDDGKDSEDVFGNLEVDCRGLFDKQPGCACKALEAIMVLRRCKAGMARNAEMSRHTASD